jgi:peptidoglycan/LPS O-acetylase OafA/YrhL
MRRDGAGFRASGSSATVAAKRSGPGRVAELDGIRALAIWAVLLFHGISTVDSAEAAGALSAGPRALFTLVAHGWLGVDLFFVLSGFLITGILLDSKHQPTYFRNFWLRRAVRILPLLFALLAVCGLAYRSHPEYFALATFSRSISRRCWASTARAAWARCGRSRSKNSFISSGRSWC